MNKTDIEWCDMTWNPVTGCYHSEVAKIHEVGGMLFPDFQIRDKNGKENFWYGFSAENDVIYSRRMLCMPWRHGANVHKYDDKASDFAFNLFVSLEPLTSGINMDAVGQCVTYPKWVIIGAMTGPGSKEGKKYLHKSDVTDIAKWADQYRVPVFIKDSLIPIVGEENMRREFPWTDWRRRQSAF